MRISRLIPVIWAMLAACTVGTSPRMFRPAVSPNGISAELELVGGDRKIKGELLSATDSALVLATPNAELTLVRYSIIHQGRFSQIGILLRDGRRPEAAILERLRLVSRYPQGMTPEMTGALLTALGKSRPAVPQ